MRGPWRYPDSGPRDDADQGSGSTLRPALPDDEKVRTRAGNVLPNSGPGYFENSAQLQGFRAFGPVLDAFIPTICVRVEAEIPDAERLAKRALQGAVASERPALGGIGPTTTTTRTPPRRKSKRGRRRKPGKRGPKGSKCLTTAQRHDLGDVAHEAERRGWPLNILLTVRSPADLPQPKGKRVISRVIGNFGKDLQRRGCLHVGLTTYENKRDGSDLHGHHLAHLPPACADLADRWHRPPDVHVRPADRNAIPYLTKQRRRGSPDWEAYAGLRYQQGGRIIGPRASFTAAARQLLEAVRLPVVADAPSIAAAATPSSAHFATITRVRVREAHLPVVVEAER